MTLFFNASYYNSEMFVYIEFTLYEMIFVKKKIGMILQINLCNVYTCFKI